MAESAADFAARSARLIGRFGAAIEPLVGNVKRLREVLRTSLGGSTPPAAAANAVASLRASTVGSSKFASMDTEGMLVEIVVLDVLLPFIPVAAACLVPGTAAIGDALAGAFADAVRVIYSATSAGATRARVAVEAALRETNLLQSLVDLAAVRSDAPGTIDIQVRTETKLW